jgi:Tol biopolymer transport system component
MRTAGSVPGRLDDGLARRGLQLAPAMVILVVVAALLALLAWFVGSKPPRLLPAPFGPAVNGSLLNARDGDIFISDPHRPGERLIVGGPAIDDSPQWSRDGTSFTFTRIMRTVEQGPNAFGIEQDVMLMNAEGTSLRTLTPAALLAPEVFGWSPDGAHVAVRHEKDGVYVVSIVDTNGSGTIRPLDLAGVNPFSAVSWRAPDGAELVVVGSPPPDGSDVAIYRVRADGGGFRQIALEGGQGDPSLPGTGKVSFQDLSLSPDGATAVFWNWEPGLSPGRDASIYLLDLDTGLDRRLVFDRTASTDLKARLTPDGLTIVFERKNSVGFAQLMVAPLDASSPPQPLGSTYVDDIAPEFELSPDGATVLTAVKGGPSLFIDVATDAIQETPQAYVGLPSWQRLAP